MSGALIIFKNEGQYLHGVAERMPISSFYKKLTQKDTETQWRNEWRGKIFSSYGSSNSGGVAILIRNGVDCSVHFSTLDPLGRFIILKVEIDDKLSLRFSKYLCAEQRQGLNCVL